MSGSSWAGGRASDLTVWNDFSVCRPSSGINDTLISETENKSFEHLPREGPAESTPLQLRPATECQYRESCVTPGKSGAPQAGDQGGGPGFPGSKEEETGLSYQVAAPVPAVQTRHLAEEVILREKAEEGWPGPVVELQLSLSQEGHKGTGAPVVALLGAGKSQLPDPDRNLHHSGIVHINSAPASEKGDPSLRSSKTIQISGGHELRVLPAQGARDVGLPRVEVILDCADRQRTEGCRLQAGNGGVDAPREGGQSEAPPSLVCFAVSSEGTEQGEDPRWEPDHSRPHKHRARHARESAGGRAAAGPGWLGAFPARAVLLFFCLFFKVFLMPFIGFWNNRSCTK